MGKVKVLEKNVSDKIAAGEVVERPASVIKELLENAVDAGASSVCVEIKGGGISYMRVTDNGSGMTKEDVSLSVIRHATSKIATEDDLTKILTLGFRGEALSSIAAVSRLEIYTKVREEDSGTHMVAYNGEILDVAEAGCPDGTTVVVRNLFQAVPARMKFLKKDFTEAGYIEDIVSRLALSHPEISVKFINNGKEIMFTPGDNLLSSAIYAVYGKDIKNAMVEAHFEERGVSVSGMCGKSAAARSNRGMENFFVNGRYIKSALLSRATEEAYKNELMVGKFPACVLNITLPPENVDINIHPTKLEAKFAEEKHIYHCVYWAVKNALYQSNFVPQVQEHKNIKPQFVRPQPQAEERSLQEQTASQVKTNLPKEPTATLKETGGFTPTHTTKVMPPCSSNEPPALENRQEAFKLPAQKPIIKPAPEAAASTEQSLPTAEQTPVVPESGAPVYKICGQVFATYIIVEKDGKMLMVDQHAAHERLRYEKLLQQYRGREISSQLLLCPEVLTLTATEFAAFVENQEAICDLGFLADEFGQKQIIVRGTPAEAGECDVKATMLEVIEMLSGSRKYVDDDLAAKMLYRIACRGAVKANAVLNHAEMTKLLDDVFGLTGINTCPHGRPITVEFTKEFIEKQFKRIV
ncbi:MAG TPA: DNA mismatch repair endonuclease MutL [Clostridiales bacterium]|nr:DNA mismatch repair endonuclease MutL [Clostridiales bacterium]HBL82959.1 DNA mismatch repair endonuclease MutL [Clostridiales bacterium]